MTEEEKNAVEFVKERTEELKKIAKRENELVYDDIILNLINKLQEENKKLKNTDLKQAKIEYLEVLNEKLQKENEELKIKNNAIKRESEAYAEHMIRLDNELNLEKEKSKYEWIRQNCLPQELVNKLYIPIQKVKDIIDRIDYDIKKTKEIISKNTNIYASYRKNDYQIVRLKAMNTKSLDIKKRLQKLLESEK